MSTLEIAFQTVEYALNYLLDRRGKEKALQREFVEAFREAIIQTRGYIASRRDEASNSDRDTELKLSRAWNKVGLLGRDIEPQGDFYEVFFRKSDFWSDPRGWNLSDKQKLDISLERAENEANKYLSGS